MAPAILIDSWSPSSSVLDSKYEANDGNETRTLHWPKSLDSPLAWDGREQNELRDVTYSLTESDIDEIKGALALFKCIAILQPKCLILADYF